MDYIQGDERILYIKDGEIYKPVGCLTSNPLSETVQMLETTTRNSGGWKTGIPTVQSYDINFDGFQVVTGDSGDNSKISYDGLKILKRLRQRIEWRISDIGGSLVDEGFGYITDIGESNNSGELLTFRGTIIGDSEPTFTQVTGDLFQDGSVICYQDGTPLIF